MLWKQYESVTNKKRGQYKQKTLFTFSKQKHLLEEEMKEKCWKTSSTGTTQHNQIVCNFTL